MDVLELRVDVVAKARAMRENGRMFDAVAIVSEIPAGMSDEWWRGQCVAVMMDEDGFRLSLSVAWWVMMECSGLMKQTTAGGNDRRRDTRTGRRC